MANRGGKKDVGKGQYYVWYLGWKECKAGLRGWNVVAPVIAEIASRHRTEPLPKLTLEVTRKEMRMTQIAETGGKKKGGGGEKVKYPTIASRDLTYATQSPPPEDDLVTCVLLGFNPQTRCAVYAHVYRCDSPATAAILTSHLTDIVEIPEHLQRASKIEAELRAKGQLLAADNNNHSIPSTDTHELEVMRNARENHSRGEGPSRGPPRNGGPQYQFAPGMMQPDPSVYRGVEYTRLTYDPSEAYDEQVLEKKQEVMDSLAAELRNKLGTKDKPLLLPPADYDTVRCKHGNLSNIQDRRWRGLNRVDDEEKVGEGRGGYYDENAVNFSDDDVDDRPISPGETSSRHSDERLRDVPERRDANYYDMEKRDRDIRHRQSAAAAMDLTASHNSGGSHHASSHHSDDSPRLPRQGSENGSSSSKRSMETRAQTMYGEAPDDVLKPVVPRWKTNQNYIPPPSQSSPPNHASPPPADNLRDALQANRGRQEQFSPRSADRRAPSPEFDHFFPGSASPVPTQQSPRFFPADPVGPLRGGQARDEPLYNHGPKKYSPASLGLVEQAHAPHPAIHNGKDKKKDKQKEKKEKKGKDKKKDKSKGREEVAIPPHMAHIDSRGNHYDRVYGVYGSHNNELPPGFLQQQQQQQQQQQLSPRLPRYYLDQRGGVEPLYSSHNQVGRSQSFYH